MIEFYQIISLLKKLLHVSYKLIVVLGYNLRHDHADYQGLCKHLSLSWMEKRL